MLSCLICQDAINDNPSDNNYPWVLSCGHVYHKQCIEQYLRTNNNCPKCRKHVTKSFRLFPEVLDRSETVTFLQGCVQSAELQYSRQKKQCDEKNAIIQGLRHTLEDVESKNTDLRTANVNYAKTAQEQIESFIARIKKLQEKETRLNGELNKSAQQVTQHEATIKNLQRLFNAASTAKLESENKYKAAIQEIKILNAKLDKAREETLAGVIAREAEISRLQAKLDKLEQVALANDQIKKLSERVPVPRPTDPVPRPTDPVPRPTDPVPRPTDPVPRQVDPVDEIVDDLAREFQQIETPFVILSRKRRTSDEPDRYLASEKVEKSVKQLRSDPSESSKAEASTSSKTDASVTEADEEKPDKKMVRSKRCAFRRVLKIIDPTIRQ